VFFLSTYVLHNIIKAGSRGASDLHGTFTLWHCILSTAEPVAGVLLLTQAPAVSRSTRQCCLAFSQCI
jgi:hypothetical protein